MTRIPHSFPYLTELDKSAIELAYKDMFVGFDNNLEISIQKELKKYFDYNFIVTTPSASLALLLLLKAIKIDTRNEVIISAINCWSVYNTIKLENLNPVLCDVRSNIDFRASYETIVSKITNKTKAIIITHMYGAIIEEAIILQLKKNYPDIIIIEDFSTSIGSCANVLGKYSDYAIISFGSTKPLTGGIGGAIMSREKIISDNYDVQENKLISFNIKLSRMDQLLLLNQLQKYTEHLSVRKQLHNFYSKFVNIFCIEEYVMFRAITFDNIAEILDFLEKHDIALDTRSSVQPNIAVELNLKDLNNAFYFDSYSSLPLNYKLYLALKSKGLL